MERGLPEQIREHFVLMRNHRADEANDLPFREVVCVVAGLSQGVG